MKKLFFIVGLLFSIFDTYSQDNKELYFISATPDIQLDEQVYLTVLYQLQKDSLIASDTINSDKRRLLRDLKIYPDYSTALFYEQNYLEASENYATFLNLNTLEENKGFVPFKKIYPFPISVKKENRVFTILGGIIKPDVIKYYGLNSSFSQTEIDSSDFINSILEGYRGAPLLTEDILTVQVNLANGSIKIPKAKREEDRPVLSVTIPDKYLGNIEEYASLLLKNERYMLLAFSETGKKSTYNKYIVYLKSAKNWEELNIEGNRTRIQAYGNWITGTIAENNENKQRVSPGKKYRKQQPNEYGPGFDVMTELLHIYYPGKLFIYNTLSQSYLEWETKENEVVQGDSEVLLIEDEVVYYRVNDKIYQAKIINGKQLDKPQLLLKDYRVPDIHWAFFSGT